MSCDLLLSSPFISYQAAVFSKEVDVKMKTPPRQVKYFMRADGKKGIPCRCTCCIESRRGFD
jgi:hypothetical protein